MTQMNSSSMLQQQYGHMLRALLISPGLCNRSLYATRILGQPASSVQELSKAESSGLASCSAMWRGHTSLTTPASI